MVENLDLDTIRKSKQEGEIRNYQLGWRRLFEARNLFVPVEKREEFVANPSYFVQNYFCGDVFKDLVLTFVGRFGFQNKYNSVCGSIYSFLHYSFVNHPNLNSFIDLGCGVGIPVAVALKLGFNPIGIEKDGKLVELGREVFRRNGLEGERLIQGNFLDDSFWEGNYFGVNPREPGFFLLFQPEELMRESLGVVSRNLHRDSRLVVGSDFFVDYSSLGMNSNFVDCSRLGINSKIDQFGLEIESPTYSRFFVLKKK